MSLNETAGESDMRTLSRSREKGRDMVRLAERQHGVVSRGQLLRLGFGPGVIGRRARDGRLHPLHPGVYAVGHRVLSREARWMAAVLASGTGAVLSHWSAAALWMIRPNSRSCIDITTPHKSRSWDGIKRHHKALPADEVTVHDGIPVTSVPRTIFDLAATVDVETIGTMLSEAEHRNLWGKLSLPDLVDRYPGRRGINKVRLALDRITEEPSGRKRSRLEERFAPFIRRHRLPMPRFNDWILLGPKRYQVDCHWSGTGQIVELDGWEGHGTKSAFRDDRERDRRLKVAGYSVTRLTWNQLRDEPEVIASDLRVLLRDR
jgi:very-short-patch-repair endonuclease/predicted transcriptional regulator of viral defense system